MLLASVASAQGIGSGLQPGFIPYDVRGERWLVWSIVDADSGAAIDGASLDCVDERTVHEAGATWRLRSAVSDQHGVARMRLDDLGVAAEQCWFLLSAKGYCSRSRFSLTGMECVWALSRQRPWTLQVLRWDGSPLVGAKVSACLGCGHLCDSEEQIASNDGLVTWRTVSPLCANLEVYVRSPDVCMRPFPVPWTAALEKRAVVVCDPSVPIRGRLSGKPVNGEQYVGCKRSHRGPWTRVGPNGEFELTGAPLGSPLFLFDARSSMSTSISRLANGEWAPSGQPSQQEVESPAPRVVPIRFLGTPSGTLRIICHDGHADSALDLTGEQVAPLRGRGAIEFSDDHIDRVLRVDGSEAGIDMAWPPASRIRARFVDSRGEPAKGSLTIESWCHPGYRQLQPLVHGEASVDCLAEGLVMVALQDAAGIRNMLLVRASSRGETLDLGTIRSGSGHEYLVTSVPRSADDYAMRWRRPGVTQPDASMVVGFIEGTTWKSDLLEPGDWLEVRDNQHDGKLHFGRRVPVTKNGACSWAPNAGQVRLSIVDKVPGSDVHSLVVGGEQHWITEPVTVLSGLAPGVTRIIVTASDGRAFVREVDVPSNGSVAIVCEF
jgi:hypothetical protein